MEEKKLNSVENVNVVVENSTKEKINKVWFVVAAVALANQNQWQKEWINVLALC